MAGKPPLDGESYILRRTTGTDAWVVERERTMECGSDEITPTIDYMTGMMILQALVFGGAEVRVEGR